jgi:crotonobetainyl-CoA:carnitine CoA-transferase CaiB-like acyl-CoA transferase
VVEVALFQVAAWTLASDLALTLVDGADPPSLPRSQWPSPMTCRFRCADDRWIAFCMPGPRDHWDAFSVVLDRPEWVFDERFTSPEGRAEHAGELIAACDEIFATRTRAEWAALLDEAGLVWAPVQRLSEVAADPQAEAMGLFTEVVDPAAAQPFRTVAAPFRLRDAEVAVRGPAPALGADTDAVLAERGWSAAEIAELRRLGAIGVPPPG